MGGCCTQKRKRSEVYNSIYDESEKPHPLEANSKRAGRAADDASKYGSKGHSVSGTNLNTNLVPEVAREEKTKSDIEVNLSTNLMSDTAGNVSSTSISGYTNDFLVVQTSMLSFPRLSAGDDQTLDDVVIPDMGFFEDKKKKPANLKKKIEITSEQRELLKPSSSLFRPDSPRKWDSQRIALEAAEMEKQKKSLGAYIQTSGLLDDTETSPEPITSADEVSPRKATPTSQNTMQYPVLVTVETADIFKSEEMSALENEMTKELTKMKRVASADDNAVKIYFEKKADFQNHEPLQHRVLVTLETADIFKSEEMSALEDEMAEEVTKMKRIASTDDNAMKNYFEKNADFHSHEPLQEASKQV